MARTPTGHSFPCYTLDYIMTRQNTKLESEGAEFLVLGQLLLRRILSYKMYTNMPGYDLVAMHPKCNTSARIQVKSRWRKGAPGFIIRKPNCDFVVAVKLNQGNNDDASPGNVCVPEYRVFPIDVVRSALRLKDGGRVSFNKFPQCGDYVDRWDLISEFLDRSQSNAKHRSP